MCVLKFVCVCVSAHVHACGNVCVCVFMYVYVCAHMCLMRACVCMCLWVCVCACVCLCVCACVCVWLGFFMFEVMFGVKVINLQYGFSLKQYGATVCALNRRAYSLDGAAFFGYIGSA